MTYIGVSEFLHNLIPMQRDTRLRGKTKSKCLTPLYNVDSWTITNAIGKVAAKTAKFKPDHLPKFQDPERTLALCLSATPSFIPFYSVFFAIEISYIRRKTSSAMDILVIYIALVLVVAHYGSKRQIGYRSSFFISLIFTPLVGIIAVLLSEKKNLSKGRKRKKFDIEDFRKN